MDDDRDECSTIPAWMDIENDGVTHTVTPEEICWQLTSLDVVRYDQKWFVDIIIKQIENDSKALLMYLLS